MEKLLTPHKFPTLPDRPYFITSYVSTIDGKIFVKKQGYWPIGSRNDYEYFTFLRAQADVIIEGKNTAKTFGKQTIHTLHSEKFLAMRQKLGKTEPRYMVITSELDEELLKALKNPYGFRSIILCAKESESKSEVADVVLLGKGERYVSPQDAVNYLHEQRIKLAFLDVGPVLMKQFLEAGLVDEISLTIAPKIFGRDEDTLSMVEGGLFKPENVSQWSIVNSDKINDEIFIRYKRKIAQLDR